MPSKQTIRTWLRVIDTWPEFTQEVLEHLKTSFKEKSAREKLCCIIVDGMSIRKKCDVDTATGQLIGYVD